MKRNFDTWQFVAHLLTLVPQIMAVQQGQTETFEPIHFKSGTTVVDVVVTVSQEKSK